jgi:ribonuclease HII
MLSQRQQNLEPIDVAPYGLVAGVDEVGIGPLAGDVVACAVILDPNVPIDDLRDSKRLSEKSRERLAAIIRSQALSCSLGSASVAEVDSLNVLVASHMAMQRAVAGLTILPDTVLVDGNKTPDFGLPTQAIIKGDQRVAAISAASIVAKVTRDGQLIELATRFPGYGFERHKGYPTKHHMQALAELGPCAAHRRSFAPVQRAFNAGAAR